jgi:NAD(P)-dependent dehydrogenase (short-subunit alcohol dehydrogenase family)
MIRFDDQVAVVTGSGRGLGEAYASLLAARGARVVVHDAGVTLDGFDPAIADSVVRKITGAGGMAVPCYENIETFLASRQCDVSGIILRAGDRHFSTMRWQVGPEVDFGAEPATHENIAEKWERLSAVPHS